jgi:hypothetical protein
MSAMPTALAPRAPSARNDDWRLRQAQDGIAQMIDRAMDLLKIDPAAGTQKPLPYFADVPVMPVRIPQTLAAAVELAVATIAPERGAMLIIALLRSGLTGPRKWIAPKPVIDALDHHGCPLS